jgi:hypothetical protein
LLGTFVIGGIDTGDVGDVWTGALVVGRAVISDGADVVGRFVGAGVGSGTIFTEDGAEVDGRSVSSEDGAGVDGESVFTEDGSGVDGGSVFTEDGAGVDGGNVSAEDGAGVDGGSVFTEVGARVDGGSVFIEDGGSVFPDGTGVLSMETGVNVECCGPLVGDEAVGETVDGECDLSNGTGTVVGKSL